MSQYTTRQIQDYLISAGLIDSAINVLDARAVYNAAVTYGVGANELASAIHMTTDQVNVWCSQNGLPLLDSYLPGYVMPGNSGDGSSNVPTPAPTPAPAIVVSEISSAPTGAARSGDVVISNYLTNFQPGGKPCPSGSVVVLDSSRNWVCRTQSSVNSGVNAGWIPVYATFADFQTAQTAAKNNIGPSPSPAPTPSPVANAPRPAPVPSPVQPPTTSIPAPPIQYDTTSFNEGGAFNTGAVVDATQADGAKLNQKLLIGAVVVAVIVLSR